MPETQHIQVVEEGDRVTLVCDDYELFDWMQDLFFEEHDIDDNDVIFDDTSSGRRNEYRFTFPQSVALEFVKRVIGGLDNAEVERVYLLNNTYGV